MDVEWDDKSGVVEVDCVDEDMVAVVKSVNLDVVSSFISAVVAKTPVSKSETG